MDQRPCKVCALKKSAQKLTTEIEWTDYLVTSTHITRVHLAINTAVSTKQMIGFVGHKMFTC